MNDYYDSDENNYDAGVDDNGDYYLGGLKIPGEHIITIPTPVSYHSLLNCSHHPLQLSELDYPPSDAVIDLEYLDTPNGLQVKCKNGITIDAKQIDNYYVMTPENRLEAYATRKYYLEHLDIQSARIYQKVWELLEKGTTEVTLQEVYMAVVKATNNPVVDRLKVYFGTIEEDADPLINKYRNLWREFITKPISEMTEDQYLNTAVWHLFYIFSGHSDRMLIFESLVPKGESPLFTPLAVCLFGQLVWWVLHLAIPKLNQLYQRVIMPYTSRLVPTSAFNFKSCDGFATDFWQAWVYVERAYSTSLGKFNREHFGPPGSIGLKQAVSGVLKIPVEEVDQEAEQKFFTKAAGYLLSTFKDSSVSNREMATELGMQPRQLLMLYLSFQLERTQTNPDEMIKEMRDRERSKKGKEPED